MKNSVIIFCISLIAGCSTFKEKHPAEEALKKSLSDGWAQVHGTSEFDTGDQVAITTNFIQIKTERIYFQGQGDSSSIKLETIDFSQSKSKNPMAIPDLIRKPENGSDIVSKERFQMKDGQYPIYFASEEGDCDESDEEFTLVKKIDESHSRLKKFKWHLKSKGECGGFEKTSCTLELASVDVFDSTSKILKNEKPIGKSYWSSSGKKGCEDSLQWALKVSK